MLASLLNGSSIKPDAGLMVIHLGGYDGWLEKSVLAKRIDGTLPLKSASLTVCFDPEYRLFANKAVTDFCVEVAHKRQRERNVNVSRSFSGLFVINLGKIPHGFLLFASCFAKRFWWADVATHTCKLHQVYKIRQVG